MNIKLIVILMFLVFTVGFGQEKYQPNWESLSRHQAAPEWFQDAKFGIYFHWGVYSVPAHASEWYPRLMHLKDSEVYNYHRENYGDPSKFGYHDFIPLFKAQHFDAWEWAELFKKAGAKFAGPVAEHHDGFSMWDSKVNPWNAKDMGPQKDIVGEMAKAVRENGMKFVTSFHHAFNNQHAIKNYPTGYYTPGANWPTASDDEKLRLLYGNLPREEFLELWKAKLAEVIDGYQPDLIWFDFVLGDIAEKTRMEFLAHYFNSAEKWQKEVLVTYKGDDLPREVAVEDFEKGRSDHLTEYPWLTDDTISWGSWCFTDNLTIKATSTVLHTLIDIVSKNGVLLLNLSPKADGTIPADQRNILLEIGDWLKVNGEAIYNTRPWQVYGEGPTGMGKGGHFVGRIDYTNKDVRFTRSKDGKTIYVTVLGWPEADLTIESFKVDQIKAGKVELLGCSKDIAFEVNENKQLVIQSGNLKETDVNAKHAFVFKLTGFDIDYNSQGIFAAPETIKLSPDKATLQGNRISVKGEAEMRNIGFWDNADEQIHWLVYVSKPGTYQMRGFFSAGAGESDLSVDFGNEQKTIKIKETTGWLDKQNLPIGKFSFEKPGVYRLTLRPANKETWKPVDVFQLQMAKVK